MQINQEAHDTHSIQSYSDTHITINKTDYNNSLIVSRQRIISPWLISSLTNLTEQLLEPILALEPEVILIGQAKMGVCIPVLLLQYLSKQRIGIECMSIGAACRTFNVLLSEQRAVVLGVIL